MVDRWRFCLCFSAYFFIWYHFVVIEMLNRLFTICRYWLNLIFEGEIELRYLGKMLIVLFWSMFIERIGGMGTEIFKKISTYVIIGEYGKKKYMFGFFVFCVVVSFWFLVSIDSCEILAHWFALRGLRGLTLFVQRKEVNKCAGAGCKAQDSHVLSLLSPCWVSWG